MLIGGGGLAPGPGPGPWPVPGNGTGPGPGRRPVVWPPAWSSRGPRAWSSGRPSGWSPAGRPPGRPAARRRGRPAARPGGRAAGWRCGRGRGRGWSAGVVAGPARPSRSARSPSGSAPHNRRRPRRPGRSVTPTRARPPPWPGSRTVPAPTRRSRRAGRSGRCARSGAAAGRPRRGSAARRYHRTLLHRIVQALRQLCGYLPGPPSAPARPAPPSAPPARRGQVPPQPPGTPNVMPSHNARSSNPSPSCRGWSGRGRASPGPPRQIMLIRAAQHRRQQDPVRVRPVILGELVRPVTDQPGQRHRKLPGRQRRGDHRVLAEAPRPAGGRGGGALGDAGAGPQPEAAP